MNNPNRLAQNSDWYFGLYTVPIRVKVQDIMTLFLNFPLSRGGKPGMVPWSRRMFYFLFTHVTTPFQEIQSQVTLNGPWTQLYTGFPHTTPHTPGVNAEVRWQHHNSTSYILPIEQALETDRCGSVDTATYIRQYGTMTSMCTAI
jgi:hypothetical protein